MTELMKKEEFEDMILEAIADEGDLMTLGADNGVEIDGHGPRKGNSTTVEGWFKKDGQRSYFSATVSVSLEEFSPDYGDDDGEQEEDDE